MDEANSIITEFLADNPYTFAHAFDPDSHRHTFTICTTELPASLCTVVGDCIHNLRSALDLMAIELTQEGLRQKNQTMSRTIMDEAGFPIYATQSGFAKNGRAKGKHWPSEAQSLLEELQPWKDGAHPWSLSVWHLHQLDILDKHKLLIPVGAIFTNDRFYAGYPEALVREKGAVRIRVEFGPVKDRRFPIQDGDVFVTITAEHPELQYDLGADFKVGFGKDQIIDGEPVIEALVRIGQIVDSIIETMAVKAF